MTYTTNFASYNTTLDANPVAATTAQVKRLSVDDQLALLWYAYTEIGRSITPAAPGAARLQFAEGLLNQIKQMPPQEQLQVMRDLANRVGTPISRSYGILSTNTKLAFWYQLAEMMKEGTVIPMSSTYQMSSEASQALANLTSLEFGQQITVLRNAVADMGVDPLA